MVRANIFPAFARPSANRFLFLFAFVMISASTTARAEPSVLTESEAVRRATNRPALAQAVQGAANVERGSGMVVGTWPNPQVSYMREQTFGNGTSEDYVWVGQPIDLGNRRGLRARAANARAGAIEREGSAVRVQIAADARLRFYEVLYRQLRVAALQQWAAAIDGALEVVTKRASRGDAALYDRRRLEREKSVAAARSESEQASLERAVARLFALLSWEGAQVPVSGQLLPDVPPATTELRAQAQRRPDLLALDARMHAAELDLRSAARWWVPDFRFDAGWKGVHYANGGRSDGFLVGASLSIPLWNQSAGLTRIAQGEAAYAQGRKELVRTELEGEIAGACAELVRLRTAALKFRTDAQAASREVVRIATAGYAGGEINMLELLDAYRGSADDELTALDMELGARRARVELDRVTGKEAP
jgi:cobalt-zinc-cadmium efflux system outer membrane protein